MKTDTPESDAAWAAAWDEGGCDTGLLLDALQKMERERDQARTAARKLRDAFTQSEQLPWETRLQRQPPTFI